MALKEIMITLFENKDGLTLSVTPNYSYGGERINFSFKGKGTHNNMKAYVDTIRDIKDAELREYFNKQKAKWRKRVQTVVEHTETDCWLSKGYKSIGYGKKGPTVPAVAFMVKDGYSWIVQLNVAGIAYECELENGAVSENQEKSGAIAGHRWREQESQEVYDTSFKGEV